MRKSRDSDSTSRLLAAIVAGSAVSQAFGAEPRQASTKPPTPPLFERLRLELTRRPSEALAYEFLEAVDPDTLAMAHRAAFGDQPGAVAARDALRAAWADYRHDRCRGVN